APLPPVVGQIGGRRGVAAGVGPATRRRAVLPSPRRPRRRQEQHAGAGPHPPGPPRTEGTRPRGPPPPVHAARRTHPRAAAAWVLRTVFAVRRSRTVSTSGDLARPAVVGLAGRRSDDLVDEDERLRELVARQPGGGDAPERRGVGLEPVAQLDDGDDLAAPP